MPTETQPYPVESITVGTRFRKDLGDLASLVESIKAVGLLHPIVITPDGQLIAGYRRLMAFKAMERAEISVHVVDLAEIVRGEFHENAERKDLTPSEQVALKRFIEPLERAAAKQRVYEAIRQTPADQRTYSPDEHGKARDKIAAHVGTGRERLHQAEVVIQAAEADPEHYGDLAERMDQTGKVFPAFTELRERRYAEYLEEKRAEAPTAPFDVVVVDPPWSEGWDWVWSNVGQGPVDRLAKDSAILWLWAPPSQLLRAASLLSTWGFRYRTMLSLPKRTHDGDDILQAGNDFCLVGARGTPTYRPRVRSTDLQAFVPGGKQRPSEFYRLVDDVCPGTKVEVFGTILRPDWAILPSLEPACFRQVWQPTIEVDPVNA